MAVSLNYNVENSLQLVISVEFGVGLKHLLPNLSGRGDNWCKAEKGGKIWHERKKERVEKTGGGSGKSQ